MGMQLLLCYSKPEVNPTLGVKFQDNLVLTLQRLAKDAGGHFSKVMNDTDCISCVVVMPDVNACRSFHEKLHVAGLSVTDDPYDYDSFIESCLCAF
jgi:hypothetical protein